MEESIIEGVTHSVRILAAGRAALPFFVFISVVGVAGRRLRAAAEPPREHRDRRIDRDVLVLPEVAIYSPDAEIDRELKSSFDALWQSAGWPASPMYGADGARTP